MSRYETPTYTPTVTGLHQRIAHLLHVKKVSSVKMADRHVAATLGISLDQLRPLQAALNSEGLIECKVGKSRTNYRFTEDVAVTY